MKSVPTFLTAAIYGAMLLAAIAVFLLVRSYGEALSPSSAVIPVPGGAAAEAPRVLLHVLVALAALVLTGGLIGRLLSLVGQPAVIGEVIAGILLGPSLLGRIAPEISEAILPPTIAPFLGLVAQLGVIFYMFLVGVQLNADLLRRRASAAVATAHAGIVVPLLLGSILSLFLYSRLSTADVSFTSFALFIGAALSVTAFPVLARILADRKMTNTEFGTIALTCAAADDVTVWCLLALVSAVAQARAQEAVVVFGLTIAFIGFMLVAARPVVRRWVARVEDVPTTAAIAVALLGVLLAAMTSELIGIHAIFGAFLFGTIVPHDSALGRALVTRLQDFVTILLLPAFFAFTGMRTRIDLVTGVDQWALVALIIAVATLGKFGGTLVAGRLTGLAWRQAGSLGILMNTRGLMELIVLNVGLDLGVISPTLFAMLVIMALVTTLATTPLLQLVHREPSLDTATEACLAQTV